MFNGRYKPLGELIYRIKRSPLMAEANTSDIATDAMDVLRMVSAPAVQERKITTVDFDNYRAAIPEGMYMLEYVNFIDGKEMFPMAASQSKSAGKWNCISQAGLNVNGKYTYSVNRNYIMMDIESGQVAIEYKRIAMDDHGLPLIPDNAHLEKAIVAYCKIQQYEIMVEFGDMSPGILNRVEQEYAWNIAAAESDFKLPTDDDMESIRGGLIRMISNYRAGKERFEYEHLSRINP